MDRTREAYFSFKKLKNTEETIYNTWSSIIMHLPYSFQGRRMLSEIYALDSKNIEVDANALDYQNKLKEVSKSEDYQKFIAEKLQPAEMASSIIGNLYTGSIFMGLLSTLSHFYDTSKPIEGPTLVF